MNKETHSTMKTIEKICAQGDIVFVRVDALPSEAKAAKDKIVAHSETGHHHVAVGAAVFDVGDPMICYLRLEAPTAEIQHHRPYDTHETIALGGGVGAVWQGRRQREHTPQGWRRVED